MEFKVIDFPIVKFNKNSLMFDSTLVDNQESLLNEYNVEDIPCISSISYSSYGINKEGKLVYWGRNVKHTSNFTPEIRVVEGLEEENVIALAVSSSARIYLTSDNKIYKSESNIEGTKAFYLFTPKPRVLCIACEEEFSLIVCENSIVYLKISTNKYISEIVSLRGKNINRVSAQLGRAILSSQFNRDPKDDLFLGYKMNFRHDLVDQKEELSELDMTWVPKGRRVVKVQCAGESNYWQLDDGSFYSSGDHGNGALGRANYSTSCDKPSDDKVLACAGQYYGCIYLSHQTELPSLLKGFGYNSNGEMGLGKGNETKRTPVKLAYCERKVVGMYCGYFHCQLLVEENNGERQLLGWGYNYYGQVNSITRTKKNDTEDRKNFYSPTYGSQQRKLCLMRQVNTSIILTRTGEYFVIRRFIARGTIVSSTQSSISMITRRIKRSII
eukprot:TRINITY_DN1663_c0_g2_i2.p1 TRINITY_DN1663_c0_g2~~TRINITY_DN1663_c0_g2_i2.p1  ORF type:complete len:442 (-),score=62.68 TRINITY_DN1663_c0_g2_i2:14-1339(-)